MSTDLTALQAGTEVPDVFDGFDDVVIFAADPYFRLINFNITPHSAIPSAPTSARGYSESRPGFPTIPATAQPSPAQLSAVTSTVSATTSRLLRPRAASRPATIP